MGRLVDFLMGEAEVEQFLSQTGGRGWPRERIGGRKVVGRSLRGQSHIRKVTIFHG